MSKFTLRNYQAKNKDMVRSLINSHGYKRIMSWLPTGAGKGLIMSDLVNDCLKNEARVLTIIRRSELIHQTVINYQKYHGITASPLMGNVNGFNMSNPCQVASIDTLQTRIGKAKYDFLKSFNVIIVDECHDLTSIGYMRTVWFLEGYDLNVFSEALFEETKNNFTKLYLGLTATPFRVGKKTHTFWQGVVKPIEAFELRDTGALTPIRVFAPKKIDTTGIRILASGDFDQKVLFERVSQMSVIGDVVKTYQEYGENKAAICFCVNQKHSQIIAEAFRRAGIPAIHCDANHTKQERDEAVAGLKTGRYKVLTNCNIFSTGFDAPFVEVEISARPTDSENLYIQQVGRVLRPYKICSKCKTEYGGDPKCYRCGSSELDYEKKYAVLLDHGNNTDRFGLPYDIRHAELEPIDTDKKRTKSKIEVKTCKLCFAVVHVHDKFCICGFYFSIQSAENQEAQILHTNGVLSEVDTNFVREKTYQKIKERYNTYKRIELLRRWNVNAKFFKLFEEFGDTLLDYCSEFGISIELKKRLKIEHIKKEEAIALQKLNDENYKSDKVFV